VRPHGTAAVSATTAAFSQGGARLADDLKNLRWQMNIF
jgi:hypothetical protein